MKTFDLDPESTPIFLTCINTLTSETERQWGTMTVDQMMRHLRLALQGTLEEIDIEDHSTILFRLVRPLLDMGILPKPKGKVDTARPFKVDATEGFDTEKLELVAVIDRFLKLCKNSPGIKRRHPFFGMLSIPQWQRNHGMHLQYHLEQFGAW